METEDSSRANPQANCSRPFDPGTPTAERLYQLGRAECDKVWRSVAPALAPASTVRTNTAEGPRKAFFQLNTGDSPAYNTPNAPPAFPRRPVLIAPKPSKPRPSPSNSQQTPLKRKRKRKLDPPHTPAAAPPHDSELDCDGDSDNCAPSFTPSVQVRHPALSTPNVYIQSAYTPTTQFSRSTFSSGFVPYTPWTPQPTVKVEDTFNQSFFSSSSFTLGPSNADQNPFLRTSPYLSLEYTEALCRPIPEYKTPSDFERQKADWSPIPFTKPEPDLKFDLKSIDTSPTWAHQLLSPKHEVPDSSPLKRYPRPNRNSRVTRSQTALSVSTSKKKGSSGVRHSVASSTKSTKSSSAQSPLLTLPTSAERLHALQATGDSSALRVPAFPGDNFPTYITESELAHEFSYFGKTRLLRTFRPGKQALQPLKPIPKMAPSYRNQNRRQNRPVEHDIFEGLPVRQWRKENVTVAPPPSTENSAAQNDIWAIELPHGMPKDSHLLPQHCQDLLRAARSGKIYGKRPAPVEEEEVDPEVILGDKPDKKEDDTKIQGYTVKTWKQIPRHLEAPDVEYLAKRRKNLKTITSTPAVGPILTKATVKRTDATGTEYLQDVVVQHGQHIDGEVISQTTIPDPNAQPIDPYAAPPSSKKKGPIIRKKPKGPGRGRKKGKVAAPTSVPAAPVPGAAPAVEGAAGAVVPEGSQDIKTEPGNGATPAISEDVEMADGSNANSDDDDGDDGEEGEEGDDDEGSISNQGSPSKRPSTSSPAPSTLPTLNDIPDLVSAPTVPSTAQFPPFAAHIEKERLEAKAGSPLKNVALATSALASPLTSPTTTAAPPLSDAAPAPPIVATEPQVDPTSLDTEMQDQVAESAPTGLPPPPPEPTIVEEATAVVERKEEEAEEEMLLDILENANNAHIREQIPAISEPVLEAAPDAPPRVVETQPIPQPLEAVPVPEPEIEPQAEAQDVELEPQVQPISLPPAPESILPDVQKTSEPAPQAPTEAPKPAPVPAAAEEEDDDFPDLLGGLEKSLNKPAPAPIPAALPTLETVDVGEVKEGGGVGKAEGDE
ncbi:hypothetical protein LSUE1_G009817 [Lachnellula suecica]|uniref:Uncharacterized protein n=1 Tax=Lachnellula suecica TaxID=602035 RepID=A0A8T9BRN5_9HELO|nr:hypothetical protein LSUE1_G009817 [Lachnellula suecica]